MLSDEGDLLSHLGIASNAHAVEYVRRQRCHSPTSRLFRTCLSKTPRGKYNKPGNTAWNTVSVASECRGKLSRRSPARSFNNQSGQWQSCLREWNERDEELVLGVVPNLAYADRLLGHVECGNRILKTYVGDIPQLNSTPDTT